MDHILLIHAEDIPGSSVSETATRAGIGAVGPVNVIVDEFGWTRLYPTLQDEIDKKWPCFGCLCQCYKYDDEQTLVQQSLFPYTMSLRIQGNCCHHWTEPCDTSECPEIDSTVTLTYEEDEGHEHFRAWWGTVDLGCAEMKFVFMCDTDHACAGYDPPQSWYLAVFYRNVLGAWTCINDIGGGVSLDKSWTCSPLYLVFNHHFWSLSNFPCCIPNDGQCTDGDFSYTITESA